MTEQWSSQPPSATKSPQQNEIWPGEWWSCILQYETKISCLRTQLGMIFHRRLTPQLIFLLFLVGHAGFMHLKTSRSMMDGCALLSERPKETISAPSEKNFWRSATAHSWGWALPSCPANSHYGQTDTVARVTVCRSKGIRKVNSLIHFQIRSRR